MNKRKRETLRLTVEEIVTYLASLILLAIVLSVALGPVVRRLFGG